jgi:glycosyltransferase involved in cell wall biosynthesis
VSGGSVDLLVFCQHTLRSATRSGIQRVVVESTRALGRRARVGIVKWDVSDGQLRHADSRDVEALFGRAAASSLPVHPHCHQVNYRFSDSVPDWRRTWLLFPEIPYHLPSGNEIFARVISQCREYGIRTAAIFYDLIPIRDADYAEARPPHVEYAIELLRADLIIPISRHSASDLLSYYRSLDCFTEAEVADIDGRIKPVPLGECREDEEWGGTRETETESSQPAMIMVGTVEPRKQQPRLLKALNDAAATTPALRELDVDIFGSLHPRSADALWREMERNPRIRFHQYTADSAIEKVYSRAWFSAFPSRDEGYGLPIVESLRHGVPCLTASHGAMLEVAAAGGCLTVDVNDDAELQRGLVRMLTDGELRKALREGIRNRPRRTWGHYASDVLSLVSSISSGARDDTDRLVAGLSQPLVPGTVALSNVAVHIRSLLAAAADVPQGPKGDRCAGSNVNVLEILGNAEPLGSAALKAVADADVCLCESPQQVQRAIEAAVAAQLDVPLPRLFTRDQTSDFAAAVVRLAEQRIAARATALRERLLGKASRAVAWTDIRRSADLAVVISTFNRAAFVERNVDWVLRQIDSSGLPVVCIVVDNASTDDTHERLARHFGHPAFRYVCNPSNVGMLGNLRVCSALDSAKHVWLIGDDDFILPGALQRVVETVRANPRLPLMLHNFGVYFRDAVRSGDEAAKYIVEMQVVAKEPGPGGLRAVNEVAIEHDNLFTAIYTIVMRSDLLAACFNYPFDGTPFGDLVESVPTTKYILESLPYCEGFWFDRVGIAGNAHNSWSTHRPRWHLVLMPAVFEAARNAGVDPRRVWQWTQVHYPLFVEAVDIALASRKPAHLSVPADLDDAARVFRRQVTLPDALEIADPFQAPVWKPPAGLVAGGPAHAISPR